jgi:hypothetical protein
MIVFSCPACRNALQVPPTMAGHPVTCSFCHQVITVPPVQVVPQPAPPVPVPTKPTRSASNDPFSFDGPSREPTVAEEEHTRARRAERDATQRQTANVYLLTGLALVLIGRACAVGLAPKIQRDSKGPRVLTADELVAIKDPKDLPSPWVSYTTGQAVAETNMGVGSKRTGSKPTTRFVLVPVNNKWLIVERGVNAQGKTFEGSLETWPGGPYGEAVEKIRAEHPDKSFLPVQLRAGSPSVGNVAMCLVIGLMVVGGFGCVLYGFGNRPRASRKRFG